MEAGRLLRDNCGLRTFPVVHSHKVVDDIRVSCMGDVVALLYCLILGCYVGPAERHTVILMYTSKPSHMFYAHPSCVCYAMNVKVLVNTARLIGPQLLC